MFGVCFVAPGQTVRAFCVTVAAVVALAGCQSDLPSIDPADPDAAASDGDDDELDAPPAPPDAGGPDATPAFPIVRCEEPGAPLPPLVEDREVYEQEALGVWTVELTITDLAAFDAVNAGVIDAEVPVIFREGSFGADAVEPNAALRIRGGASRVNVQKNYKVELYDDSGLWRGQREINLNKHMWDLTRVRNKMAFDMFRLVPHFTSLRTQLVDMTVNGESFGMYTWIEEPDKRFLASHGLDPDGQLYKASAFHFESIAPEIAADPVLLKFFVEPKANRDPAKFMRMVDAVNDPSLDIDDVVATYFNRDNLVTWLAVNVLLNNIDTRTQNYYLYSPSSCEGWYFLPWDYDGAWGFYGQLTEDDRERWESGLSNWWGVHLFERFYMKPANVQAVHDKIIELSETVLGDDLTAAHLATYRELVLPRISVQPDLEHLPGHYGDSPPSFAVTLWDGEASRITPTVSRFRAEYLAVIERPMPSFIAANLSTWPLVFRWEDSFDLQGHPITYDLQVSRTPRFEPADIVVEQLDIADDQATVSSLSSGTYYWRVIIRDHMTPDSWQLPFRPYKEIVVP